MKQTRFLVLAAIAVGGMFIASGCSKQAGGSEAGSGDSSSHSSQAQSPIERGKYLTTVAGCNDCHTPLKMGPKGPEPDFSRMFSGHPEALGKMPPAPKMDMPWMLAGSATFTAYSGPFGTSYAANLTPDSATGIGSWDDTTFMLAIRHGKKIGTGRPLMPPMPWQTLRLATDDDLKAIFAYLKSVPAIKNKVPDYEPPAGAPPMAAHGGDGHAAPPEKK